MKTHVLCVFTFIEFTNTTYLFMSRRCWHTMRLTPDMASRRDSCPRGQTLFTTEQEKNKAQNKQKEYFFLAEHSHFIPFPSEFSCYYSSSISCTSLFFLSPIIVKDQEEYLIFVHDQRQKKTTLISWQVLSNVILSCFSFLFQVIVAISTLVFASKCSSFGGLKVRPLRGGERWSSFWCENWQKQAWKWQGIYF